MTQVTDELCQRCGVSIQRGSLPQGSPVSTNQNTLKFLDKTPWSHLCSSCLNEIGSKIFLLNGLPFPKPEELRESIDYYKENGLFVFTEHYLMLRGYCCRSGCRHCPFGFNK